MLDKGGDERQRGPPDVGQGCRRTATGSAGCWTRVQTNGNGVCRMLDKGADERQRGLPHAGRGSCRSSVHFPEFWNALSLLVHASANMVALVPAPRWEGAATLSPGRFGRSSHEVQGEEQAEPSPGTRGGVPERSAVSGRAGAACKGVGGVVRREGGCQRRAESRWTPGRVGAGAVARWSGARRPGATSASGGLGSASPAWHHARHARPEPAGAWARLRRLGTANAESERRARAPSASAARND
jgi:hypothetical protein